MWLWSATRLLTAVRITQPTRSTRMGTRGLLSRANVLTGPPRSLQATAEQGRLSSMPSGSCVHRRATGRDQRQGAVGRRVEPGEEIKHAEMRLTDGLPDPRAPIIAVDRPLGVGHLSPVRRV
eukprot:767944-Hanusia_phi.AAC.7